jgi:hypothetical protein
VRSFVLIKSSSPSMVGRVEFNNDRFRGSKTLQHQWLPVGAEFIQDQIRFKISVKDAKEKYRGGKVEAGFCIFMTTTTKPGSLVGFMHGGCWTEFG